MSAPTIPASTESTVIVSEKLNADIIIAETITDGVANLSGGYLSNLNVATNPQDVARRSQVSANAFPGGSVGDVQYNDNGFAGSNNFNFSGGTLTVNGTIQDQTGMAFNQSGIISGVTDPIGNDELATKAFVDSLSSTTNITEIKSNSNEVWTASSIYGVIIRSSTDDLSTGFDSIVSVTDTTPTAAAIISNFPGNPSVGTSFRFLLLNDNFKRFWDGVNNAELDDLFQCSFVGGAGVTIEPSGSFVVPRTHTLEAYVIFDNVTGGSEAVTIRINSIEWFPKAFYFKPLNTNAVSDPLSLNIGNTQITTGVFHTASGQVWSDIDISTSDTTIDKVYTTEAAQGLALRAPAAASSDNIGNDIATLFNVSQTFTIVNTGAGDITLTPVDTLSTYSPASISILAGQTVTMGIVMEDASNTIGVINPGSNYTVGPASAVTGGTGSGMTAEISAVITAASVFTPGTDYTTGVRPLVGGTGSGLTYQISQVNAGTGAIETQFNIYDPDTVISLGYQAFDVMTVGGTPGTGGSVGLILNGAFVNITNYGSGYSIGDILTVEQAGSGNDCQIQIVGPLFSVRAYADKTN